MHRLEEAARAAVESCTPETLQALRDVLAEITQNREAYRATYDRAEAMCGDDLEVDDADKAFYSPADDGTWVNAWIWVRNPMEDGDDDDDDDAG